MTDQDIWHWKDNYNYWLSRHGKAEQYLNDNRKTIEEREVWIPTYQEILKELNYILALFDTDGIEYTHDEALKGFVLIN